MVGLSWKQIFIITLVILALIRYLFWLVCSMRTPGVGHYRFLWNRWTSKGRDVCPRCRRKHDHGNQFGGYCSARCLRQAEEERRQRFRHDCRCERHVFQRLTYRGKCWSCYMEHWEGDHPVPHTFMSFLFRLHGFRWVPTMRTSEKGWNGDKIAFDTLLEQMGVGWMVYVKFYEDERGKCHPLVGGKSGSTAVNYSGCDLNFSMNPDDGPARRFLLKHNYKWYHDHVMVKGVRTEKLAYELESRINRRFGLYGS